jgi:hypothetical protein
MRCATLKAGLRITVRKSNKIGILDRLFNILSETFTMLRPRLNLFPA